MKDSNELLKTCCKLRKIFNEVLCKFVCKWVYIIPQKVQALNAPTTSFWHLMSRPVKRQLWPFDRSEEQKNSKWKQWNLTYSAVERSHIDFRPLQGPVESELRTFRPLNIKPETWTSLLKTKSFETVESWQSAFRPPNGPVESRQSPFDRAVAKAQDTLIHRNVLQNPSGRSKGSWPRSTALSQKWQFEKETLIFWNRLRPVDRVLRPFDRPECKTRN